MRSVVSIRRPTATSPSASATTPVIAPPACTSVGCRSSQASPLSQSAPARARTGCAGASAGDGRRVGWPRQPRLDGRVHLVARGRAAGRRGWRRPLARAASSAAPARRRPADQAEAGLHDRGPVRSAAARDVRGLEHEAHQRREPAPLRPGGDEIAAHRERVVEVRGDAGVMLGIAEIHPCAPCASPSKAT